MREPHRQIELIISVSYATNIEEVKRLFADILSQESRIIMRLRTTIQSKELGSYSLNFVIRIWITTKDD